MSERLCLLRLRLASGAPFAVTRTVIGGDDDERLVVRPDVAQPPDQITDETVHESDLRQMSLVERIGVGRAHSLEQRLSTVHRGLVVRTTVPPSRRDVFERHVRQHQVDEVQPRRPIDQSTTRIARTPRHGPFAVLPPAPHASDRIPPTHRPQAAGPL